MNNDGITHTPAQAISTLPTLLVVTPAAKTQLRHQWLQHHQQGGPRLATAETKDGCAGMRYLFEWADAPLGNDVTFSVDADITLFIDAASLPFLQGCCIDYVREGINAVFKFTNPNASATCGCGESFTVK